jgi:1-acyl-sn-glycerol-3-phosphate acyltransferase
MTAEVVPIGEASSARCRATTAAGRRCRNRAGADGFCAVHTRPDGRPPEDDRLAETLGFVRRRLIGDYEVDEFGFDPELTERVLAPAARFFHQRWWRIDWIGLDHIPSEGSALLVANHAGTLPWDALMLKFGVLDHHPKHRHVRLLAADLAFQMPFVGALARKSGNTLATEDDAFRLLNRGEVLGVFPEGFKGVGKLWTERYRLQRFGRGGFIELALRARCPIVPVSIVGSEEIYPMLYNTKTLARLFGFPYFPITPFFPWLGPLGAIPIPSKWIVELGRPIPTDDVAEDAWEDPITVFEMTDRVREEIQQTLRRNLLRRRSIFS